MFLEFLKFHFVKQLFLISLAETEYIYKENTWQNNLIKLVVSKYMKY